MVGMEPRSVTTSGGGEATDASAVSESTGGVALDTSGDSGTTPIQARNRIVAEAIVVPVQSAALSMPTSGTVAEIVAAEGEQLDAGALIARLQSDREVVAVAQAQATVAGAQAVLDQLLAGARPEEIAAAQAGVDAAQAQLDIMLAGARPEEIAAFQAGLTQAQGAYAQVAEGAADQEIIAARADLASAQTAVTVAQRAYDQVSYRDDIGALPQSQALQNATTQLEAAQARYDTLMAGARPSQFTQAAAAVDQARANLERAQNGPSEAEINVARAGVASAQAQLDLLLAGARPEQVLAAQADLAAAQTGLMQAQVTLADKELRAPFAGTLAALEMKVGQQITPGTPVAYFGDTAQWQVETTDLTELDVVNVGVGDRAVVEVDALPDTPLTGQVVSITPFGQNLLGDVIYKVTIALDEADPRLRWNMSAAASIEP
jgi:HlyD family secretion protein